MSNQYQLDFLHLARQGARLAIEDVCLAEMPRLQSVLHSDTGCSIAGNFEFTLDNAGICRIDGHITATLQLSCQRCLEALNFSVDTYVRLGMVRSLEEADRLPEEYEPLIVRERKHSLLALLEDELLLALPHTPMHKADECHNKQLPTSGHEQCEQAEQASTPFAALADMAVRRGRQAH